MTIYYIKKKLCVTVMFSEDRSDSVGLDLGLNLWVWFVNLDIFFCFCPSSGVSVVPHQQL